MALLFVLHYFYRVEKFSWSVSEREREREKKKIKVKCSDIFPEKRPPYSLIGFMFFCCSMIDASLAHRHVSREQEREGRMVLMLHSI